MEVRSRPTSSRAASRMGSKSEGYSEYGETSGIGSGTQTPTHEGTRSRPTSAAIVVPTADDPGETRENCVMEADDGLEETDEGFEQGDAQVEHAQTRQQREVKFSDQAASADDEDPDEEEPEEVPEHLKPGTPEAEDVPGEPFTLFTLLPSKEVITLRDVRSGNTVSDVQALIEMTGGIPSECYSLGTSNGATKLSPDVKFVLGGNITSGSTIRIIPHPAWEDILGAIRNGDLEFIQSNGETYLQSHMTVSEAEERERTYTHRLFLCLFMACARGEKQMCHALIEMGADMTGRTTYGNTALHAAARHNQLIIIDLLLKNGAKSGPNAFGKTATETAKEAGAFSSERYLRLHKWSLTGYNYVTSPKPSPRASKPTSATSQRSSASGRITKSGVLLPKGADNFNDQSGQLFNFTNRALTSSSNLPKLRRRAQSAPVARVLNKTRPSTTQSTTRGGSKYHSGCLQQNGVVTISKPRRDYLGADTVRYVAHAPVASATTRVENVHVFIPSAKGDSGFITVVKDANTVDVEDTGEGGRVGDNDADPDRTVLAETLYRWENDQNKRQLQKKPRAKSASARFYKTQFHKYLEPQEPVYYSRVKELRARRAQSATLAPEEEERQMRNDVAYQSWMAKKTAEGAFAAKENDEPIIPVQKHSKEENARAFERWLEEKEDEEPPKMNCLERLKDRENVVQFGSTSPEEPMWPSSDENHLSYQKWLLSQRDRGKQQFTSDEPADALRRRIEDKRRKTILNVRAYGDWLDEKQEEEAMKRKLMLEKKQTAQKANEEKKKKSAPKQVHFSKWLSMTEKNEKKERERKKRIEEEKAEEERMQKEDWRTGTNVKTFKQWYLVQGQTMKKGSREDGDAHARAEFERQKEERAKMARESFESWAIQKAMEELQLEKTKLTQEERRLEEARGQKQTRVF